MLCMKTLSKSVHLQVYLHGTGWANYPLFLFFSGQQFPTNPSLTVGVSPLIFSPMCLKRSQRNMNTPTRKSSNHRRLNYEYTLCDGSPVGFLSDCLPAGVLTPAHLLHGLFLVGWARWVCVWVIEIPGAEVWTRENEFVRMPNEKPARVRFVDALSYFVDCTTSYFASNTQCL